MRVMDAPSQCPARGHRAIANLGASFLVILAACAFGAGPAASEPIKIGLVKLSNGGPTYIAQEKGYFAAEGLTADLVYFDAAQPIALAVVSGDVDVGVTGLTAGFYNLAGQGALRIIAASNREFPGFQGMGVLASNRAYEAGLKSYQDLAGHSLALPVIGGPAHYATALIAEKYGLDLARIRLLPLQTIPNQLSALAGGQADAAVIPATAAMPAIQRGEAKLLGWIGDEAPYQISAVFTAAKFADHRDSVDGFLRAYRKAVREYHAAFIGADEKRADGATAPEVAAIIAKYVGQTVEEIERAIPDIDAEARLDVKDVRRQIAWYKSQGMLKAEVDSEALIDKRYVIPLPDR